MILSNDTYFDNNLSVLDCSLRQSPYCINIDELCFGMSEYGKINSIVPSKYWTENPINPISLCDSYIMNGFVYNNAVIADGASCELSANGYYLKLSPNKDGKLFKSIMTNVSKLGELRNNSSVWLFDQSLLSNETVNIYLKVTASSAGTLTISTDTQSFYYNIDKNSEWIYGVYNVSGDGMKFSISSDTDAIKVLTYSFEK
ncbi:hypothetical protein SDC9_126200 [bioreactor metagenome]|uniref:Uncharacterized protein n=1 Tax=bioreactor metagenome TaxID=1076179 RepID=A0A645CQI2_9ZZZZ